MLSPTCAPDISQDSRPSPVSEEPNKENRNYDTVDASKMSSDRELQMLQLKKQDLERALEEQGDRVEMAFERMKKAEGHAQECQVELGRVRVENSELDKLNVRQFMFFSHSYI